MTAEPSPRPWSLFVHDEQEGGDGEVSICAGGEWIATMNLRRSSAKADAALIVEAVNEYSPIPKTEMLADAVSDNIALVDERDRLRDIVRRMSDNLARYHLVGERDCALLREARVAIGEGEPPTGEGVR